MKINSIKDQFPIFNDYPNNQFLYLDSASTTLKHRSVLLKIEEYYSKYSAYIHRSVYPIAEKATNEFDKSIHFEWWEEYNRVNGNTLHIVPS